MPFAASNPHFYGRYPNPLTEKLDGFKPDKDKHQSFIIIEPVMGVPIDQSARSQSNVILPEFKSNFRTEIQRFSNMALPTFWVEFVSIFFNFQSQSTEINGNFHIFFFFFISWMPLAASKETNNRHRKSSLFHVIHIASATVCDSNCITCQWFITHNQRCTWLHFKSNVQFTSFTKAKTNKANKDKSITGKNTKYVASNKYQIRSLH